MTQRLAGRVALISGAARGQGAVEARMFVEEGARVVLGDVIEDELRATADAINATHSGSASAVVLPFASVQLTPLSVDMKTPPVLVAA